MSCRRGWKTLSALTVLLISIVPGHSATSESDAVNSAELTGLKVRIETPHYEASLSFYTQLLGMRVLDSWDKKDDRGAILGFGSAKTGEAFLELAYSEYLTSFDGLSLQFRVPDLASVEERLQGVVPYRGPTERPWGSVYLYLDDPSGVRIIVFEGEL